jgi:hypothetical protein
MPSLSFLNYWVDMEIYCHQMGMLLEFSYCISVNDGLPCRNIIRCWEKRTDIYKLLKERFTEEELRMAFSGLPKSRIERIIDELHRFS